MKNLDNAQFLDLLEQNLGRRWPKEWRERAYNLVPWLWTKDGFRSASKTAQQDAINAVRQYHSDAAMRRLTK